jgi:ABC-type uncharacterized transport system involved in gliding motility auxiliary subunit
MKKHYQILWISLLLLLYLVVVGLWIAIPEELFLNLSVTAVGISGTLLYMYFNREKLLVYAKSHFFKKIQEAIVFFFLVFALLSIANYWAYKHPIQHDSSVIKINSLTDQSVNVLKSMNDGPIVFKLFARKAESLAWLVLLDFYRIEKPSIEIEKIDIDVRPDLVSEYQITEAATLVIEYNNKRQKVLERDELNITNGLVKVSRTADPVVYLTQGNGEADINSPETEGLKLVFEAAKNSAVDLRPLSLLSTQEVPFDAKALVLWGPKKALQDSEMGILKRFLERGGNLVVALDPDLNGDKHENLRTLLRQYKIITRNDLIIDRKNFVNGSNGSIPIVDQYEREHSLTKNFKGQVFFPLASSLDIIPDDILPSLKGQVWSLTDSSPFPDSWGESDPKEVVAQNMSYTQGSDRPGPLSLALAFESEKNRIVVFGNSTFVLNAYAKFGNNFAFFLNTLAWSVGEDRLVSFNLPIVQSEPLFISAPQLGVIFYFSVLFAPLILFFTAIYMYRRKRNK